MTTTHAEPFSLADARDILRRTPSVLDALLRGLPDWLVASRDGAGTWNATQVLAHLAWCEINDWMPRVERVLTHGTSEPFVPLDREGGFARYQGWTSDALLDEFATRRRGSLEALDARALQPGDLARQGRHPEFGPVTLEQLLATWATHDLAHLAQITRTLTRAEGRYVGPWRKYLSLLQDTPRA